MRNSNVFNNRDLLHPVPLGDDVGRPRPLLSGFNEYLCPDPRVVASLQPWAEISERLRRNLVSLQTDALPNLLVRQFEIGMKYAHVVRQRSRCSPIQCWGLTPKALANSSPGFERSREPWGYKFKKCDQTLKGLGGGRTLMH